MTKKARLAVRVLVLAVLLTAFGAAEAAAQSAAQPNFQTADGVGVYLGVVPAQLVRGHPPSHPEQTMHGGESRGRHQYHVLVAVFEEPSGTRVSDAEVTARVEGQGHIGGTTITLEPMTIEGAVTYGNFIALPGSDRYSIRVDVERPGKAGVSVTFEYEHGQQ